MRQIMKRQLADWNAANAAVDRLLRADALTEAEQCGDRQSVARLASFAWRDSNPVDPSCSKVLVLEAVFGIRCGPTLPISRLLLGSTPSGFCGCVSFG
jgi:hypothetical protein